MVWPEMEDNDISNKTPHMVQLNWVCGTECHYEVIEGWG